MNTHLDEILGNEGGDALLIKGSEAPATASDFKKSMEMKMKRNMKALLCAMILILLASTVVASAEAQRRHSVIIVGAGVAGLAAAWELAQRDVDVAVIEMQALPGGTALMSEGAVCIVGTPAQVEAGISDFSEIAYQDFMAYGRDENGSGPDAEWVRYYVHESRHEIYDWLIRLGVRFEKGAILMPGNRVPRWHKVIGKGRGLVEPIYSHCRQSGKVTFYFRFKAVSLIRDDQGRIVGVRTQRLKDGAAVDYLAPVVILATGGFQGNAKMVREYWPEKQSFPERLLIGAGATALGTGHEMAREAGARLVNMHYQWNYSTGLANPTAAMENRGSNAFSQQSIWVNRAGRRFVNESQDTKATFSRVLEQPGGTYWAIFDHAARGNFFVSGWSRESIEKIFFEEAGKHEFIKSAMTFSDLAQAAGLPPKTLENTVHRWNEMVSDGSDSDFGRIGCSGTPWSKPVRIEQAPFYAVQFYPLTRKSMGGVAIDRSCRVLKTTGQPVFGLYAAGELTGLAGVNGKASLEGTFLGACILTGRVAGRAAAAELGKREKAH